MGLETAIVRVTEMLWVAGLLTALGVTVIAVVLAGARARTKVIANAVTKADFRKRLVVTPPREGETFLRPLASKVLRARPTTLSELSRQLWSPY